MNELADKKIWTKHFGVLPLKLNPIENEERYLMLNGGTSDFCFQTFDDDEAILDEISWSSSTKNYLRIVGNDVIIRNWYENKTEKFSAERVESNLDQFYNYIFARSYKTESDIVPFISDLFKQLRNVTLEESDPIEALNLLFMLLVSIDKEPQNVDKGFWGIRDIEIPESFAYFAERLREGVKTAKPNLDLILRHSASKLFQDANRTVISFNLQRDLFGGSSKELITRSVAYNTIHYTPQYLARTIVENCLNSIDLANLDAITILDPSCGSSEFLIETLKQLKNKNYSGQINLKGFDNSKTAVETSSFLLNYENKTQWGNSLNLDLRLVEDSLTEEWGLNNILLMNPPFTSFELLKDKQIKDVVREVLSDVVTSGRPNQASAFFLKAVTSLDYNGVFGCVLPNSIFTLDIYNKLRNKIKEIVDFRLLGKLGNFVFEDAMTDVSIVIGNNGASNRLPKVIWTKNEKGNVQNALRELRKLESNNENSISTNSYSIYTPDYFPILENNWRIISLSENKFIYKLNLFVNANKLVRLQDIFGIKQGALLGVKDIFIISEEIFINYSDHEKTFFRKAINNSAIKNGAISLSEYLWYPYDKNGIMILSENELQNLNFAETHLFPNKEKLQLRTGIDEKWWGLTRPRNWQFEKTKRLYSSRFGNSSSFGYDISGDAVIIEGNAFIPKKEILEGDLYFYLAIFSSNHFDKLLSIFSKELAGGKWYDLGNNFIKKIPIPNCHSEIIKNSDEYAKLVEIGKELALGNSYAKKLARNQLLKLYPEIE